MGLYQIRNQEHDNPPSLKVEFFGANPQIIDLSFMLIAPDIAQIFANTFAVLCSEQGKSPLTRKNLQNHLGMGYFRYLLAEKLTHVSPKDLTGSAVRTYTAWLDKHTGTKGKPLSVGTKRHLREALTKVLKAAKNLPDYSNLLPEFINIDPSPWLEREKHSKPTRVMTDDERDKILSICVAEIKQTMQMVNMGWSIIEKVKKSEKDIYSMRYSELKTFDSCLVRLNLRYPGVIPSLDDIKLLDVTLNYAITFICYREKITDWGRLTITFHPDLNALVPFILYLTFHCGFNTSVMLGLKHHDVNLVEVLGSERIRISGHKGRGNSEQSKSFPIDGENFGPSQVLMFLKKWIARIRSVAQPPESDLFFIFESPKIHIDSFGLIPGNWTRALERFRKRNDLEYFGLREMRQTYIEHVRVLFKDDPVAVARAAGHRSISTQQTHYTSDAVRQRNDERVGHHLNQRSRWIDSQGVIDPRNLQPQRQDVGAATPGMTCLDPYDSPIESQIKGRLCDAYGGCLTCPLAQVNAGSPHALVRLLQLKETLEAGQTTLSNLSWLHVWGPRLNALNEQWLPLFDDPEVVNAARILRLPPLPTLESMS